MAVETWVIEALLRRERSEVAVGGYGTMQFALLCLVYNEASGLSSVGDYESILVGD
jgi:hypothetical protein